jgi:hypothetical protein
MKKPSLVSLMLLCCAFVVHAKPLKAGLARAIITPEQSTWLSGYAARTKPSEGKLHDIWVKALALEDERGNRVVLVTSDILGFSREVAEVIAERAQQQFSLRREQLMLNSSHTHSAPIVRSNLIGAYDLDAEQTARVLAFSQHLQEQTVRVIGEALKDLTPAKLSFGHGVGSFAKNRRMRAADGTIRGGVNDAGPVEHDVPVLLIESEDGKTRGIVFGYACHNTTLTGEHYAVSGDYAGFAQLSIEAAYPGATALFVMGCGADINPHPRSKLENAQAHGASLAASVTQALKGNRMKVSGQFKTAFERIALSFGPLPTREEFTARLSDTNVFKQRHAKRMLERYERDGKLAGDYPYTIQIFQLGKDFTLIGLAGEVVTDYVLRLKRELGAKGLWVAGYTNEVMAYIPSARMFSEGGYEVVDSMIYYDQPTSWSPELEEKIIGKTRELARRVGRKVPSGK